MQGWIQKVKRQTSIYCSMAPRRMESQAQIISSVTSDSKSSSWEPQWSKTWVGHGVFANCITDTLSD